MPEPVSIGAIAAGAAAKKAGETFGERLLASAGNVKTAIVNRAVIALRVGFEAYLEKSYTRCRYFKTVLNPYEPADLEETYIRLKLESPNRAVVIDDSELFTRFRSGEHCVVTGLAGSGKSMLMRFLTLDSFSDLSVGTPLFVELRKINTYPVKELVPFILKECSQKGKAVTEAQFELALRSGLFTLILDGFDELEYEHRDMISEQIIDLERDFPSTKVIVSSRPDDDRFRAWESFSVYRVADFTLEQASDLIKKTKYNEGVKERFLHALETKLVNTHSTFLTSPLLTTIMLLTFEEYAEIPTKMHSFYARAFDTLFQKHDADKDQFVRKIKTGLGKEDFKLILSAFCAMSYVEEKFTFSPKLLTDTADAALKYSQQVNAEVSKVKGNDFTCDLVDAVCILQPDGLDHTFVHRSFQEYFSAVFIEKSHSGRIKPLLNRLSRRFQDNVIGMALDMAREKVEAEWVLPTIDVYTELFARNRGKRNIGGILSQILPHASIYREDHDMVMTSFSTNDAVLGPIESLCRAYPDRLGAAFFIKTLRSVPVASARDLLLGVENKRKGSFSAWSKALGETTDPHTVTRIAFSQKDNWWLDKLAFNETFDELLSHLAAIKKDILVRQENRESIIEGFL